MDFGGFHPIIVHFPVVILSAAAALDVIQYLFFNKKLSFYSHWLFFAAAISIIPSIITGLFASQSYATSIFLLLHQTMAFFLLALVSVQAVLRICYLKDKHLLSNKFIVFLSVIIFLLVSLVGDVGGILARGSSPFAVPTSHANFDYNSADKPEVRSYTPEQLGNYLAKKIDVLDVIPIFKEHKCASCHADYFEGDIPLNFSKTIGDNEVWLSRDENGNLVDWPKSPFYKTTILLNRMPLDKDKNSKGISWSERLTLIHWLENNAPTEIPKSEET